MATDPSSLPDHQSSWPLVSETLNGMGVSFQQAQAALIAHGYPCGPTSRLPAEIVIEVMEQEGYERERLRRV